MRRRLVLLGAGVLCSTFTLSQVKKQFSVEDTAEIGLVDLNFKVNSGRCFIKQGQSNEVLNVYSDQDYESYGHSFEKNISNKTCKINLELEDAKSESFSQSISYRMFGRSEEEQDKTWKVYLTENKAYNLDLDYGIGEAHINLGGLSVNNLKVHTGSADVNIAYPEDQSNLVEMDTFYVKVDLGSVSVEKLNHSKAKHVVADIGFGNLMLDFTDKTEVSSTIQGSVGAGNLMIFLPQSGTPVKVKIKDSWLCKVKLSDSFTKISKNTYVNQDYQESADNVLNFDLDVSMGSIVFKERN
ncbi:MAG: hypothetical protein AAF843_10230 [Bacteroidota bacterium]